MSMPRWPSQMPARRRSGPSRPSVSGSTSSGSVKISLGISIASPLFRASNVFDQTPIELRTAIAEKAHARAVFRRAVEVDRLDEHAGFMPAERLRHVAPFVGDEAEIGRAHV